MSEVKIYFKDGERFEAIQTENGDYLLKDKAGNFHVCKSEDFNSNAIVDMSKIKKYFKDGERFEVIQYKIGNFLEFCELLDMKNRYTESEQMDALKESVITGTILLPDIEITPHDYLLKDCVGNFHVCKPEDFVGYELLIDLKN